MDAIFKALNDPARRALLDSLRATDGQTLTELEEQLDMSRFGVMKHLKVLEDAHLVVTRKRGRFKYHYLNALPLQEMITRWVHPFLQPHAAALTDLKAQLEETSMSKPDFIMSTFINCTQDALWDALTRGDIVARYHFACQAARGTMQAPGDEIAYLRPDGAPMLSNRVIAIEPKTRIEMVFLPAWGDDTTESRCVYLVEPTASGMKLTVEHYDIPAGQPGIGDGWTRFLSGIKTFLETGETHRFFPEMQA